MVAFLPVFSTIVALRVELNAGAAQLTTILVVLSLVRLRVHFLGLIETACPFLRRLLTLPLAASAAGASTTLAARARLIADVKKVG